MADRISNVVLVTAVCAALATASGTLAARTENRTPDSSEMSPSQWRAAQLIAADKSDQIMRDARKQPGCSVSTCTCSSTMTSIMSAPSR